MEFSGRITAVSRGARLSGRADARGPRGLRVRGPMLLALAVSACGLLAATARAAVPAAVPAAVSTGGAQSVSYGSAVLSGSLNPEGSDTSYYFQYGPTRAYGSQSAIADAGAGVHTVSVTRPIAGLAPLTLYHYRLVAVNAGGVASGPDRTLLTTKVPLTLQILPSPDPAQFGETVTVQGTLSGTENGGRAVILQANPFPFTAGFQDVGNPELTMPSGGFSFVIPGASVATQYRVLTTTNPPVSSPLATETVAVRVDSHIGRARRARFMRVYGTVTPAENGMRIAILRIEHGRGVLVGGAPLLPAAAGSSRFSSSVPLRRGAYRVLASITSGGQVSAYGRTLVVR